MSIGHVRSAILILALSATSLFAQPPTGVTYAFSYAPVLGPIQPFSFQTLYNGFIGPGPIAITPFNVSDGSRIWTFDRGLACNYAPTDTGFFVFLSGTGDEATDCSHGTTGLDGAELIVELQPTGTRLPTSPGRFEIPSNAPSYYVLLVAFSLNPFVSITASGNVTLDVTVASTPRLTLTFDNCSDPCTSPPSLPTVGQSLKVTAQIVDSGGSGVGGFTVQFSSSAKDLNTTGGHDTTPGRDHEVTAQTDVGRFDNLLAQCVTGTTAPGSCDLLYIVSEIGGEFRITARANDATTNIGPVHKNVTVGLALGELLGGSDFFLTGNDETQVSSACHVKIRHPSNHSATEEMLLATTALVRAYFLDNGQTHRLGINDMSLPMGGLFDICNNWRAPHKGHRLGTSVDIDHALYDANKQDTGSQVDADRDLGPTACLLNLHRVPEANSIHYEYGSCPQP